MNNKNMTMQFRESFVMENSTESEYEQIVLGLPRHLFIYQDVQEQQKELEQMPEFLNFIRQHKELYFLTLENGVYSLPIMKSPERKLPEGYAFSGGAARSLLLHNLGYDYLKPRDLDIVRIGNIKTAEEDTVVAKDFMPDDFRHGHGVKTYESPQEYLNTRDLTLNEIYATNTDVFFTQDCLRDTLNHIIRPTQFEGENGVRSKMALKIIRFYASRLRDFPQTKIDAYTENRITNLSLNMFWIALNLDKAYQEGKVMGDLFLEHLKDRNILPEDVVSPQDAVLYLSQELYEGVSFFRHTPIPIEEEKKEEERWFFNGFDEYIEIYGECENEYVKYPLRDGSKYKKHN